MTRVLGTVFAAGARTALGPDLMSTALLLRTGIPAIGAAPLAANREPVTMAFDPTLEPFLTGEERASELARGALAELAAVIGSAQLRGLNTRVALAFPEPRVNQSQADAGASLAREMRAVFLETLGDPEVDVEARGSAGLAYALPGALDALARRQCDAVVAGGTHSDYDPAVIEALLAEDRLFHAAAIDAVIPGEAAAFVLIGRPDLGSRLGLAPLLNIVGIASDTGDLTPHGDQSSFDAGTLAGVFEEAARELPPELRIGWALGDHGIEHFRLRELYAAITRTHALFCEPMAIDSPPQRLGRTGSASLGLFLALAADAYRRGYAPMPVGLLFAGSDGGERGALLVTSP